MGNTNCVAGGGCPHRSDIAICNQTDIELQLDANKSCQRECEHKGFIVTNGKIVEGCEPPSKIAAQSIGQFSVSGREGTTVAPGGKVFYKNEDQNLQICITWSCSGWTNNLLSAAAQDKDCLSGLVTGKSTAKSTAFFKKKEHSPWHEVISVIPNSSSMEITIKPKAILDDAKGILEQAKGLKLL